MVRDTTISTPVPPSQLSSPQRARAALVRLVDDIRMAHYKHQQIGADIRRTRAFAHVDRVQHGGRDYC
jgi:hypothetical protein